MFRTYKTRGLVVDVVLGLLAIALLLALMNPGILVSLAR
jgi:hypothetical protein